VVRFSLGALLVTVPIYADAVILLVGTILALRESAA
jgi:hypothetical protein